MINRYRKAVPKKGAARTAVQHQIKVMKTLTETPVKMIEIHETERAGEMIDLGIFPQPSFLVTQKEA